MNLKRWLSVFLMMGLILALNPLVAQAGPKYHHPREKAYGWHGPRHHNFERHHKHFQRSCKGPHHPRHHDYYAGPPQVAYVTPVTPIIAMPYPQPEPYNAQPATPGLSGQLNWNF
jgi:hypothetical protein